MMDRPFSSRVDLPAWDAPGVFRVRTALAVAAAVAGVAALALGDLYLGILVLSVTLLFGVVKTWRQAVAYGTAYTACIGGRLLDLAGASVVGFFGVVFGTLVLIALIIGEIRTL